jgi:hypothetical protein
VRPGKSYVSFYLMSIYSAPELMASMSPELRRRMQGKACFSFTKVDERLFAELARLTEAGLEPFIAIARQADRERNLGEITLGDGTILSPLTLRQARAGPHPTEQLGTASGTVGEPRWPSDAQRLG